MLTIDEIACKQCFALESLLFLERAIILYHEVEKYRVIHSVKDKRENNHVRTEEVDERFTSESYQLTFEFMNEIYKDIDGIIENAGRELMNGETEEDGNRRGILIVMKAIYDQFVSERAEMEINVSSECRAQLKGLFECLTEEELLQRLSLQDMKGVFHAAILETYQLCFAVYNFQFRHYVARHTKNTPRPSLESMSDPLTPPVPSPQ